MTPRIADIVANDIARHYIILAGVYWTGIHSGLLIAVPDRTDFWLLLAPHGVLLSWIAASLLIAKRRQQWRHVTHEERTVEEGR